MNNDPKNKKPQDNKPQNGDDGRQGRRIVFLMVAALIATLLINSLYTTIANAYLSEITYNEFQTYLDKDEIAELEFQSDRMVILTRDEAKKPSAQQRLYYTGYIPNVSNDELKARLDAQGVEYNTEIVEQASPIVTFVVTWLLPVIIMYALFSLLMRSMTKRMGGGIGGIGESKAKAIVRDRAGSDSGTFREFKLDYDDGRRVYDVEFYSGSKEYDYEIDAASGDILSWDYDAEYYTGQAAGQTGSYLSEAEVRQIVEDRAGVSGTFRELHLDRDDGRVVYEGEMRDGWTEYEFTLDAVTGTILEWDVDRH